LCAPVELWRGRGRGRRLLLLLLGCMPVLRGELSVSWVAVRGSHPSTLAALPCARARCIVIRLTIIVMRLTIVLPPGAADARDRPQAAGVSDGVAQAGAAHALGLHPAVGYPELRGSLPPQKRPKAAGMLRLDRCMPAHPAPTPFHPTPFAYRLRAPCQSIPTLPPMRSSGLRAGMPAPLLRRACSIVPGARPECARAADDARRRQLGPPQTLGDEADVERGGVWSHSYASSKTVGELKFLLHNNSMCAAAAGRGPPPPPPPRRPRAPVRVEIMGSIITRTG
jgi:hypothetical protein